MSGTVQPGIAQDIFTLFSRFFYALVNAGRGFSVSYPLNGTSLPQPLLDNIDRLVDRFTVLNNSSGTVLIGWSGVPVFHLGAYSSYTFTWKNPKSAQLTFNDNGQSSGTLDVIS